MERMRFALGYCLVVSFLLTAGGCALGDRKIALLYEPMKAESGTVASPPPVAVAKFLDVREEKVIVGEVRNGYGMKMAEVHLAEGQDVGGWVANAFCTELRKRGVQVTQVSSEVLSFDGILIRGTVQKLYTKMYMSYDTLLLVKVEVIDSGVPLLSKEFVGKGGGLAVVVDTGEYERTVRSSLQDLMEKALPVIMDVVSRRKSAPASKPASQAVAP